MFSPSVLFPSTVSPAVFFWFFFLAVSAASYAREDICDTCPKNYLLAGRKKERLEERGGRACDLEAAVEVCEALAVVLQRRLAVSACLSTYQRHALKEAVGMSEGWP